MYCRTNTVLTRPRDIADSGGVRFSLLYAGLLLGLTASSSFAAQFFSVGVKAGFPFSDSFQSDTYGTTVLRYHSGSSGGEYIVGPMGEVHLPLGLSVEADALYRPLNFKVSAVSPLGATVQDSSYSSWEFPILAKWRVPFPVLKPYIEGGPSFRAVGGHAGDYLSNDGLTFGVGVELRISRVRVGPEIRFTHWGSDASGAPNAGIISAQNQGEFLVGFSF